MALIALFITLNTAIWSRDLERIDEACYRLGQRGYMAYPLFVRFPLWSFKYIGIE